MPSRNLVTIVHPALGGLDVSTDPSVLDPNFLTAADNVEYLEAGQRRKRLGTIQYSVSSSHAGTFNSTGGVMISSATNVRALSDVWIYTSLNVQRQRYASVAGASIFKSNGQGIWEPLTVSSSFGSNSNLKTYITMAGSRAVISDGIAAPVAYNPTTTTLEYPSTGALTTFPVFEDASYHISRMFFTGLSSAVDRVSYSGASNIFDTTGTDSGNLDFAVGDGDRVIGLSKPFYGNLYIFKGPHYGSIHELSGQTPLTFATKQVASGTPAVSHGGIITTPTDIYWISQFGVHSLQTTVKFGNVESAFLSLPIQKLWRTNVIKRTDLENARGFWDPKNSIVGWVITFTGDTIRKVAICYNYALSDPSPGGKKFWSLKRYPYGINQVTPILVSSNMPSSQYSTGDTTHMVASNQGLAYLGDYPTFADDLTAVTMQVQTPLISRFRIDEHNVVPETQEKSFAGVVTFFNPIGTVSTAISTLIGTVDGRAQQLNLNIGQSGALFDFAHFDVDVFGGLGVQYIESILEERGRSLILNWSNNDVNSGMELFGYGIRFYPAESEAKER